MENVTIRNLHISGNGTVYLLEGTVLTISNDFQYDSGTIKNIDMNYISEIISNLYPIIDIMNECHLNSNKNKYLYNIKLQNNNRLIWNNGNMILFNSTIVNSPLSQFLIYTNKSSTHMMYENTVYSNFDIYKSYVLNNNIVLKDVLPGSGAVYDIQIDRGIFVSNSGESLKEIYPLEVQNDRQSIAYYNSINITNSSNETYNKILSIIDVNECGVTCMKTAACLSFDYNVLLQKCYLSQYDMNMVGGLNQGDNGWNHYESNGNKTNLQSNIIVSGEMVVLGDENVYINVRTVFNMNSSLLVMEGGKISFNQQVLVSSSASVQLCGGSLIFNDNDNVLNYNRSNTHINVLNKGENEGLVLSSGSSITAKACLVNDRSVNSNITFQNGNHEIYGAIKGNYTLTTQNHGNVTFYQNLSQSLLLSSVVIENSSIVTVTPSNSSLNKYNEIGNKIVMYLEKLVIINNGELLLKAMTNIIDISYLFLNDNGLVSAEGSGTKF